MEPLRETVAQVRERKRALSARLHATLLGSKAFSDASLELLAMAPPGHEVPDMPPCARERGGMFAQQTATQAMGSRFVSAEVNEVERHLEEAAAAQHPEDKWAGGESLQPSLAAAVANVAAWRDETPKERQWRQVAFRRVSRKLWQLTLEVRAAFSPRAVLDAEDVSMAHVALIGACAYAFDLDKSVVDMLVFGADAVGVIDPSSVYTPDAVPAEYDFDALDHEAWNAWLLGDIAARASRASAAARETMRAVWDKTRSEEAKGYIQRTSMAALDSKYGEGFWRAIRRFAVVQGASVRACENAAESAHNAASSLSERLTCETADLPVRIAAAFAALLDEGAEGGVGFGMRLGTDDLEAAYRRVLVSTPQYTVVAVWDTDEGSVALFEMAGFNFGLHSAVLSFNRVAHIMCEIARRIFAVCTGHYYDDYVCTEPSFARDSGQVALNLVLLLCGFPASQAKHVGMAVSNAFLGVRTDFAGFPRDRMVKLAVDEAKQQVTLGMVREALAARQLAPGAAAKMAGRLAFSCAWAACRVGRAAMQPLYRRASDPPWTHKQALDEAVLASLAFFEGLMGRERGLPPRQYYLGDRRRPVVKIWTDASAGEVAGELGRLGFVVCFPAERVRGEWVPERWVHSSAPVQPEFIERFTARKTYIGQYELAAAVAVYYTLPELAGRTCIHWVDNTSALAALAKGYSRAIDSARIVHTLHAWNVGARVSTWFEYVRSKANISDLPSRNEFALLNSMGSVEVEMRVPAVEGWFEPAVEWLERGVRSAGGDRRGRKRPRAVE